MSSCDWKCILTNQMAHSHHLTFILQWEHTVSYDTTLFKDIRWETCSWQLSGFNEMRSYNSPVPMLIPPLQTWKAGLHYCVLYVSRGLHKPHCQMAWLEERLWTELLERIKFVKEKINSLSKHTGPFSPNRQRQTVISINTQQFYTIKADQDGLRFRVEHASDEVDGVWIWICKFTSTTRGTRNASNIMTRTREETTNRFAGIPVWSVSILTYFHECN